MPRDNTDKDLLSKKNLKYAKLHAYLRQKLKLAKDRERTAAHQPTHDRIEEKIFKLSRSDVEFRKETSTTMLCLLVEQAQRVEAQMFERMKNLIVEHKRQLVLEKENVEANYSFSLEKLGTLTTNRICRKRKLSVSNC